MFITLKHCYTVDLFSFIKVRLKVGSSVQNCKSEKRLEQFYGII